MDPATPRPPKDPVPRPLLTLGDLIVALHDEAKACTNDNALANDLTRLSLNHCVRRDQDGVLVVREH